MTNRVILHFSCLTDAVRFVRLWDQTDELQLDIHSFTLSSKKVFNEATIRFNTFNDLEEIIDFLVATLLYDTSGHLHNYRLVNNIDITDIVESIWLVAR